MWKEKSMIRKRSVRLGQCGSLVLGMILLVVWPAWGVEPENEALVAGGKDLFLQRCASCHGESGKGDGPTAAVLKNPPADLTTISLKHSGQFPRAEMIRFIDGERPVPAHGPRHMPVWGEVFREEKSDSEARMRLHSLVAFLESLQRK
jgi:mono/diheme cytochrome c family protein